MTRTNNTRSHRFFSAHAAARLLLMAMVALTLLSLATEAKAQGRSKGRSTRTAAPARNTNSTSSASGYRPAGSKITFGGELALNYLMMSADKLTLNGVGFHIAGVADFPVDAKTGIMAKAGYESKHGSTSVTEGGAKVDASVTLNYFEVAGLVRHDLSDKFSLHGGLAMQFDAGGSHAEMQLSSGGSSVNGERNGGLKVPTQFALVGGVGYRVSLSPTMDLVPNATLNFGLTSPSSDGSSSAHTFRIGARLMFR